MGTIKEILNSLPADEWSYYKSECQLDQELLSDNKRAVEFIEDYFELAGKEKVFSFPAYKKNKAFFEKRAPHIISTFVLGLKIAECSGVNIKERDLRGFGFQYYWFLSCLFHDVGYIYEKESNSEWLESVSLNGISGLKRLCRIHYIDNQIFNTYPKTIVDCYLRGRAKGSDDLSAALDHGITGGLLLYDGLRKSFEKSWEQRISKEHSNRDDFYVNNKGRLLHCSESHFKDYAIVADAVIAHNIFWDTLHSYLNENGYLYSFINRKICMNINSPFCFILCLADTIEPIKRNADYIDRIHFTFDKKTVTIVSDERIISEIFGRIKDDETWLGINVNKDDNRVKILIE